MSRLGLGETRRDIPTVPTQSDKTQGRHARRARTPFGRPLRFAPWPAVGPGPDVAELRRARSFLCLRRFWLLSSGLYVSAPPRLAPP
jgi:hypothetical protein